MKDDEYICELKGVTRWFWPDCLLFERVNFHISRYEKVLWTGYAGSGRTSLIQMIAGEMLPDEGNIRVNGTIAVIPEKIGLIGSMTMQQHVALPLLGKGGSFRESMKRAAVMMEKLGITGKSGCRPYQMTAYDRAITALGQALVQKADLILADTFMTGLSRKEKEHILGLLFENLQDSACLLMSDEPLEGWPFDTYYRGGDLR